MTEAVFAAEPVRLIISAVAGIAILLILILKCKLHPVLSLLISALAFGLAKKTKKSTLTYALPLLAGLATGFAFIPPSAGSVLVANMLDVNLGVMIAVGVPVGIIAVICAGVLWGKFCGKHIYAELPSNLREIADTGEGKKLPPFGTVLGIILIPLVLILLNTVTDYLSLPAAVKSVFEFLGTPFVSLIIATLCAMFFLEKAGIQRR